MMTRLNAPNRAVTLDHETRANRFLDSLAIVRDLLTGHMRDITLDPVQLGQLIDVLCDEATIVVIPVDFGPPDSRTHFALGSNDDG